MVQPYLVRFGQPSERRKTELKENGFQLHSWRRPGGPLPKQAPLPLLQWAAQRCYCPASWPRTWVRQGLGPLPEAPHAYPHSTLPGKEIRKGP